MIPSLEMDYDVKLLCKVMSCSRSSYYASKQGTTYQLKPEQKQFAEQVTRTFVEHRRRYGVRRLAVGLNAGHHRIRSVLRKNRLKAIQPRSFIPRTTNSRHPCDINPNLLLEDPLPQLPDRVWVGDITYIPVKSNHWAYLAVFMDLYSSKIVGWQLADHMREELVMEALKKITSNRLKGHSSSNPHSWAKMHLGFN